jgi:Icc-related predicted phosphoesterase
MSNGKYPTHLRLLAAVSILALCATSAQAARRRGGHHGGKQLASLRFVVYGDTRDGHDIHRKLVALIMKQQPDLVIQTGDLVNRGSKEELWKIYDDITGEMRRKVPVYPARGNHDVGGPGYEERVTAPFSSGNKLYYSFDKANCHFVALAVDEHTSYGPDSEQYKWLVEDLEASAKRKPAHTFVFFHVPPYSIGSHGSDLDVRKTLCPVFQKYGVRAVLNGHDHNYYHTTRDGITYIVTGGGAPLYPVDPGKGAIPGDKYESVHNIVVCEVKGNLVAFTALREDGSMLDRFSLHAKEQAVGSRQ